MGLVERLGAALVAPRRAFATAETGEGGANDMVTLSLLEFLCVDVGTLVAMLWAALVVSPMAALGSVAPRLAQVVGANLLVWAGASLLIALGSWGRRPLSRSLDLAGVAFVPFYAVKLAGQLVLVASGGAGRGVLVPVVSTVGIGLAVAWGLLAIAYVRRTPEPASVPGPVRKA